MSDDPANAPSPDSVDVSVDNKIARFPQLHKDGYTMAGWYYIKGKDENGDDIRVKVSSDTILTSDVDVYADWQEVGRSAPGTCTLTRNYNEELIIEAKEQLGADILNNRTITLPIVKSITDSINSSLVTVDTMLFGYDNKYVCDMGTSQRYTISVERVNPVDYDDTLDDLVFAERWSNSKWISKFIEFTDVWQNGLLSSDAKARAGGFLLKFDPGENNVEGMPGFEKRGFITGSISYKIDVTKLSFSFTFAVATMHTGSYNGNLWGANFHNGDETLNPGAFTKNHIVGFNMPAPPPDPAWVNAMRSKSQVFAGWVKCTSTEFGEEVQRSDLGGGLLREGDPIIYDSKIDAKDLEYAASWMPLEDTFIFTAAKIPGMVVDIKDTSRQPITQETDVPMKFKGSGGEDRLSTAFYPHPSYLFDPFDYEESYIDSNGTVSSRHVTRDAQSCTVVVTLYGGGAGGKYGMPTTSGNWNDLNFIGGGGGGASSPATASYHLTKKAEGNDKIAIYIGGGGAEGSDGSPTACGLFSHSDYYDSVNNKPKRIPDISDLNKSRFVFSTPGKVGIHTDNGGAVGGGAGGDYGDNGSAASDIGGGTPGKGGIGGRASYNVGTMAVGGGGGGGCVPHTEKYSSLASGIHFNTSPYLMWGGEWHNYGVPDYKGDWVNMEYRLKYYSGQNAYCTPAQISDTGAYSFDMENKQAAPLNTVTSDQITPMHTSTFFDPKSSLKVDVDLTSIGADGASFPGIYRDGYVLAINAPIVDMSGAGSKHYTAGWSRLPDEEETDEGETPQRYMYDFGSGGGGGIATDQPYYLAHVFTSKMDESWGKGLLTVLSDAITTASELLSLGLATFSVGLLGSDTTPSKGAPGMAIISVTYHQE